MKTFFIILFVIVAIPSVRAASQKIDNSQSLVLVAQYSTQNPEPLIVRDTTQNVTIWAKIAASLGVASLVSTSIGIVMGITTGSVLIVAGFGMAFYASIIGAWAQRGGSSKSNTLAKKGILFSRITMVGIATYMLFGLLWGWYWLISFFTL